MLVERKFDVISTILSLFQDFKCQRRNSDGEAELVMVVKKFF